MHAVSQASLLARATWQSRGLPCAGHLAGVPDNREGHHSLASSLAESMRKSTRTSIPNRPGAAPGHPKSTQNRSRGPLGTPRGAQEHAEGIPGVSWKRLGAPPARPRIARSVHKSDLGRQERRLRAPGNASGAPKSTPTHARDRKIELFSRGSFAKRRRSDFPSIFVDLRFFCQVCKVSEVPRL